MTHEESKHRRGGNPANTGEYSAKANSAPERDVLAGPQKVPSDREVTGRFAWAHNHDHVSSLLEGALEPENLFMDGEVSRTQAMARARMFRAQARARSAELRKAGVAPAREPRT